MIGTIEAQSGVLYGSIAPKATLQGRAVYTGALVGAVVLPIGGVPVDDYAGSYEIVPSVEAQTMETRGKRMTADVQIQAIPYYEVSNTDGLTAIIGG